MEEVSYQLTADEYYKGLKTTKTKASLWGLRLITASLVAVVISETGLLLFDVKGRAFSNSLLPVAAVCAVSLVVLCLLPWIVRSSIRKQLNGTPAALSPVKLTIVDSGLHFRSEYNESTIAWAAFIRWTETVSVFTIFFAPKVCYVIPKRVLNAAALKEFRETLQRKIGSRPR